MGSTVLAELLFATHIKMRTSLLLLPLLTLLLTMLPDTEGKKNRREETLEDHDNDLAVTGSMEETDLGSHGGLPVEGIVVAIQDLPQDRRYMRGYYGYPAYGGYYGGFGYGGYWPYGY